MANITHAALLACLGALAATAVSAQAPKAGEEIESKGFKTFDAGRCRLPAVDRWRSRRISSRVGESVARR
jgi:hypothetical protein